MAVNNLLIEKHFTLDLKTKDRMVKPLLLYENSVPLYNHEHQPPDCYLFVSLLRDKNADEDEIRRFQEAGHFLIQEMGQNFGLLFWSNGTGHFHERQYS